MLTAEFNTQKKETITYYDRKANAFAQDTAHADVSIMLKEFVEPLPAGASILDWGCGSGRDSRAMLDMGFSVTSTDASKAMCSKASELFGIDAICENFDDLDVDGKFDGIWACASLLHVSMADLPDVLKRAKRALQDEGVLYMSFKYGTFEGMRDGRWFTDMDETALTKLVQRDFETLRMWITSDVRLGRENEKWLNCLLRKRS